jgi:hypothetical protein
MGDVAEVARSMAEAIGGLKLPELPLSSIDSLALAVGAPTTWLGEVGETLLDVLELGVMGCEALGGCLRRLTGSGSDDSLEFR